MTSMKMTIINKNSDLLWHFLSAIPLHSVQKGLNRMKIQMNQIKGKLKLKKSKKKQAIVAPDSSSNNEHVNRSRRNKPQMHQEITSELKDSSSFHWNLS